MEFPSIRIKLIHPFRSFRQFVNISPEKTLRDIQDFVNGSEPIISFYTWDKDGKRAVGKLDSKIKDVLKDGDIIYGYYYHLPLGPWTTAVLHNLDICQLCGIQKYLIPQETATIVVELSLVTIYCFPCFKKIENFSSFSCFNCGETTTLTKIDGKLEGCSKYMALCHNDCLSIPKKLKECASCGIPLIKSKKCGVCLNVMYCSRECQKANWVTHKPNCSKN